MISRLKGPLLTVLFCALVGWIGHGTYRYFTHFEQPVVSLHGIVNDGSYARIAQGSVSAKNSYKIASITIKVDDKQVFSKRVKASTFDCPFSIDTTTLSDGPHSFELEAVDASYHANSTVSHLTINVDNSPLHVACQKQDYTVDQGKTLQLKINSNKKLASGKVVFNNTTYQFAPASEHSTTYECFIPIDCEQEPFETMLNIDVEDLVGNKQKLSAKATIKAFSFVKQKGFSVSSNKMSEEKEVSLSMQLLDQALEKWVSSSPKKKLWSGPFELPMHAPRQTTPFGEIRVTPERGRYLHKGLDLANRPKAVVWAAQSGKVIIKERYHFTGNTVVLDHGLGIFTMYAHLEDFADIAVGSDIKKGNPVGRVGMTGYANGYHLHWEVRINNVSVDPLEWTTTVY